MWGLTGFQTNLAGLDSRKFQRRSRRRMLAKESSSKARSIPNKPSSLGNIWKHPKNTNDTKKTHHMHITTTATYRVQHSNYSHHSNRTSLHCIILDAIISLSA